MRRSSVATCTCLTRRGTQYEGSCGGGQLVKSDLSSWPYLFLKKMTKISNAGQASCDYALVFLLMSPSLRSGELNTISGFVRAEWRPFFIPMTLLPLESDV